MGYLFPLTCCTSFLRMALTLALMLSWASAVSRGSERALRPNRWCRELWSGTPSASSVEMESLGYGLVCLNLVDFFFFFLKMLKKWVFDMVLSLNSYDCKLKIYKYELQWYRVASVNEWIKRGEKRTIESMGLPWPSSSVQTPCPLVRAWRGLASPGLGTQRSPSAQWAVCTPQDTPLSRAQAIQQPQPGSLRTCWQSVGMAGQAFSFS